MFRSLNKDGALFFPKKPQRDMQYPERPQGQTRSRVLMRRPGWGGWSFSPPRSSVNAHSPMSESGDTD